MELWRELRRVDSGHHQVEKYLNEDASEVERKLAGRACGAVGRVGARLRPKTRDLRTARAT